MIIRAFDEGNWSLVLVLRQFSGEGDVVLCGAFSITIIRSTYRSNVILFRIGKGIRWLRLLFATVNKILNILICEFPKLPNSRKFDRSHLVTGLHIDPEYKVTQPQSRYSSRAILLSFPPRSTTLSFATDMPSPSPLPPS